VIELYAITDAAGPPLPGDSPLRVLPDGELAIVYGPAVEREVSAEALWRHEELVESLMGRCELLPFRYGTRCEDEAAAARVVAERREGLTGALERVRGAAEIAVRVLAAERAPATTTAAGETGAAYVVARARAATAAREVADAIHEPLAALARDSRRRTGEGPSEPLRAAYLVDRDRVGDVAGAVARLQERHPELRLLCTGPWPPYSFAGP
jgi:hypothetical protein